MKKFNKIILRHFTNTVKKQESKLVQIMKQINIESPEEKETRYEDELYYFEKEWKQLQDDKKRLFQDYYTKDLTDHQQRECDLLIQRFHAFSPAEKTYFQYVLYNNLNNIISTDRERPNVFEKEKSVQVEFNLPGTNPNQPITEGILYELLPFIASGYFSGGAAAKAEVVEKKEEKIEEKPKEVLSTYIEIKL
jgi:hypothetical protein